MTFRINQWYKATILVNLLLLTSAVAVMSQQPVNHARGLSSNSYLSDSFEHINLYNGNLTMTVPIGQTYSAGGNLKYRLALVYNSTSWDYTTEEQTKNGVTQWRTKATPSPKMNAGHGWKLTLGALYPPKTAPFNRDENNYLYVAPDGSEHQLIRDKPDIYYSKDGSFLRLSVGSQLKLEFPNGQVHFFNAGNYQLNRMQDRANNWLNVDTTSNASRWTLSDSQLRHHAINLTDGRVTSVEMSAFGGQTALYQFEHVNVDIKRDLKDTWIYDTPSPTVNVWLLQKVILPESAGNYEFEYTDGSESLTEYGAGLAKSATLPTGGHYKWYWTRYIRPYKIRTYPSECTPACHESIEPVSSSEGVRKKEIYSRPGGALLGDYDINAANFKRPTIDDLNGEAKVIVTSPAGDETVHYFNNAYLPTELPSEQYSLPFTTRQSRKMGDQTLYLSQEFYDGPVSAGKLVRSVYVKYDTDPSAYGFPANPRVVAQRIVYADAAENADTLYENWNGMGEFGKITERDFEAGDYRELETTYAARPGEAAPWILNRYTQKKVTQKKGTDLRTAYTQTCFDAANGELKYKRTLRGAAPDARDLFTIYNYTKGDVTRERHYGGDIEPNAPLGAICTDLSTFAVIPKYELHHTYSEGALETSKYRDENFFLLNNEIDPNTGLVRKSTDASGVSTTFQYDELNRVKSESLHSAAGNGLVTLYDYFQPSVSEGAQVKITRQEPGGRLISWTNMWADPFGRTAIEQDSLPGEGTEVLWSTRETKYNAMGWVVSASEMGNKNNKTVYDNFDPFGRAERVTAPDGKVTTFEYKGINYVKRTSRIGSTYNPVTGNVVEQDASVTENYDRFGRLTAVLENAGPNESQITTNYQYDVGSRLRQVEVYNRGGSATPFTNVALASNGGRAFASTSHASGNFPPIAMINGDRTGADWGSPSGGWNDGTPDQFPDYVEIHFEGEKSINKINLVSLQDDFLTNPIEPTTTTTFTKYGVTAFTVSYFNSATNQWVQLANITGNNKVLRQVLLATPVRTAKLSIAVNSAVSVGLPKNSSRIVEVEAFESTPSTGEKQTRTFNYDNRGFLLSETHPEITGAVSYSNYDALGNAGQKSEGGKITKYDFDSAARLKAVLEGLSGGATRPLKSFEYYEAAVAGQNRLGKLKKATRHNWVKNPYVASPNAAEVRIDLSEEYIYNELDGRVGSRTTVFNDSAENAASKYRFQQAFTYDYLGNLDEQSYPQCLHATCANQATLPNGAVVPSQSKPRTLKYTYSHGYLRRVGIVGNARYYTGAGEDSYLRYHPNKMFASVPHANSTVDAFDMDPNNMVRSRQIRVWRYTQNTGALYWDSGTYQYDGNGNITKMGADWYTYDKVNRVKEGTAGDDGQGRRRQAYAYDATGNVTKITNYVGNSEVSGLNINVDASTNRILFPFNSSAQYDNAGNFRGSYTPPGTTVNHAVYEYDALNMVEKTPGRTYLYGPNDERMWVIDKGGSDLETTPPNLNAIKETVTLRGLRNEVLREYEVAKGYETFPTGNYPGNWRWTKDYIYKGTSLLAAETKDEGTLHYHQDHLGSTRLVTNAAGSKYQEYDYYPFGGVAGATGNEKLRFTGHERENNYFPGQEFDYMHARYYAPNYGRFMSVDPGRDFDPKQPQSWNRYSYVRSNPINRTDPTGRIGQDSQPGQQTFMQAPTAGITNSGEMDREEFINYLTKKTGKSRCLIECRMNATEKYRKNEKASRQQAMEELKETFSLGNVAWEFVKDIATKGKGLGAVLDLTMDASLIVTKDVGRGLKNTWIQSREINACYETCGDQRGSITKHFIDLIKEYNEHGIMRKSRL